MSAVMLFLSQAAYIIGTISLALGSLGVVLGALGLLRLGDTYQRMHGAGIVDTGGAGLILFGLLLLSPDWTVTVSAYPHRVYFGADQPNRYPRHCARRACF